MDVTYHTSSLFDWKSLRFAKNIAHSFITLLQSVVSVEEAFSCFLVHKTEEENERNAEYQKKLCAVMTSLSTENQEAPIRQYLTMAADLTNRYKMKQLLTLLENLVNTNIIQARFVLIYLA